jgi:phage shock protein PspC (stress-responsive transcriptional regulator)
MTLTDLKIINICFKLTIIFFKYFTIIFYINLSKLTNYSKYDIKMTKI